MIPSDVGLYNQSRNQKYVVAMGACGIRRRPFKRVTTWSPGVDKFVPVDVYIPGWSTTPQALTAGLMKLQEKIDKESSKVRWYRKGSATH